MARTLRATSSELRIAIRFLPGAKAPAIKRMQWTDVHASKLVRPPTADPQHRYTDGEEMYRNIFNIFVLLNLILFNSCNPFDDSSNPPTKYTVQIDSVFAPSSVTSNESVELRLFGIIGPNLCYKFHKFESKKTSTRLDITVIGIVPDLKKLACATMISELRGADHNYGKEFIISPPISDPFLVVVHQPNGSTIEKTIRVVSQ